MDACKQVEKWIAECNEMIASIDARLERTNRILAWAEKDRRRFGEAREEQVILPIEKAA